MRDVCLASMVGIAAIGITSCGSDTQGTDSTSDDLVEAAPLGPEPSGKPTQYPILFGHGFGGSSSRLTFHTTIVQALRNDHHLVDVDDVPPFAPVAVRAKALAAKVDSLLDWTHAEKLNLVVHSMGGLDARELISVLGYGDRIASVTTISSPHRGSGVADVGLQIVAGASDEALDALAALYGKTFSDLADDSDLRAALYDISEANADAFDESHPDDGRVVYQSWAGVSSIACVPNPADKAACGGALLAHRGRADCMDPILVASAAFAAGTSLLPNDGLVTVRSAVWGNFRGCFPADHADEIGAFDDPPRNTHTGFDYIRFYRNLAFDLADQGL